MTRFSFHVLAVILAAVFAVYVAAFFIGCDSDDGTESHPDAIGTYYAIADFSGGDQSIMLVLQMPSSEPASDGYYVLTGFVSYGDSTWDVNGTTKEDTLNFIWSTLQGLHSFAGNILRDRIQGNVAGPGWMINFTAYREAPTGRDIAGQWEGGFQAGSCYPPGGMLTASLNQTGSAIAGTLFVTGDPEMGDTLVITEGFFHDPIFEVTAIDSGTSPPARLILLGTLGADDSLAGGFDWWWDRCFDEGFWHLERTTVGPQDTGVFSGILGVVFVKHTNLEIRSGASVHWQIDGEGVTGATITFNGGLVPETGDGYYMAIFDTSCAVPGEDYIFNISHPDYGNAMGTVRVPGFFMVTSPGMEEVIPQGEDLQVTFTEASEATFYTAQLNTNPAFGIVAAPASMITLAGTDIQTSGMDMLEVEAVRGDMYRWQETQTGYFGLHSNALLVEVE